VGDDWVPQDEDFDQIKSVRGVINGTSLCMSIWALVQSGCGFIGGSTGPSVWSSLSRGCVLILPWPRAMRVEDCSHVVEHCDVAAKICCRTHRPPCIDVCCKRLLLLLNRSSARTQDNFTGNTLDYLILPLIALQLKTAVGALNTVNERRGLVRTQPRRGGSVGC